VDDPGQESGEDEDSIELPCPWEYAFEIRDHVPNAFGITTKASCVSTRQRTIWTESILSVGVIESWKGSMALLDTDELYCILQKPTSIYSIRYNIQDAGRDSSRLVNP
jgi:hypothetical protein